MRVVLVVVPVAAAGLTIAGAGAVTVGALAVPVCGAAVARCLVHSSYCTIFTRACLHVWTRGLVGWLVPARLGVCLSASAGRVFVGDWVGRCRAQCVVVAPWVGERVGRITRARAYARFAGGLGIWRL